MNMGDNILWRCRRGTKELDLLLERYYLQHSESFSEAELEQFQAFLAESDDDLIAWLLEEKTPKLEFKDLVYKLKINYK